MELLSRNSTAHISVGTWNQSEFGLTLQGSLETVFFGHCLGKGRDVRQQKILAVISAL
jgi:hypothetical protein